MAFAEMEKRLKKNLLMMNIKAWLDCSSNPAHLAFALLWTALLLRLLDALRSIPGGYPAHGPIAIGAGSGCQTCRLSGRAPKDRVGNETNR
eukprot:1157245-Pelagomonas_calceolata.AAC.5